MQHDREGNHKTWRQGDPLEMPLEVECDRIVLSLIIVGVEEAKPTISRSLIRYHLLKAYLSVKTP